MGQHPQTLNLVYNSSEMGQRPQTLNLVYSSSEMGQRPQTLNLIYNSSDGPAPTNTQPHLQQLRWALSLIHI